MIQKNTSAPAEIRGKIQSFVESLLDDNADLLRERFAELPAKDMFNVLAKLLPYVAPRQTTASSGKKVQETPLEAEKEVETPPKETIKEQGIEAAMETAQEEMGETAEECKTEEVVCETEVFESESEEAVSEAITASDDSIGADVDLDNPDDVLSAPTSSAPVKTRRPNKGSGTSSKNKRARKRR